MARSIMAQLTLFGRLRQLRASVKAAFAEIEALRDSMNLEGEPEPESGWVAAEDLHIQLGAALEALDMAIDYLKPVRGHIDQPVRQARKVAHV